MKSKVELTCKGCGYILKDTGIGDVIPPCPECGDVSSWMISSLPPVAEMGEGWDLATKPFGKPEETGFEALIPNSPEAGDTSSWAIETLPPVQDEDGEVKEKRKSTDPFGKPEETGFADLVPTSPEEGDMSSWAIESLPPVKDDDSEKKAQRKSTDPFGKPEETGFAELMPASPEEGDTSRQATKVSLRPIKDEEVKPGKPQYKCDSCGLLVESTGFSAVLPPCPECGDMSNWVVLNLAATEEAKRS